MLRNIRDKDLRDPHGNWLKYPEDWVLMFPLLEMAGPDHVAFLNERWYFYRATENSDFLLHPDESHSARLLILTSPPYSVRTKQALQQAACDWNIDTSPPN